MPLLKLISKIIPQTWKAGRSVTLTAGERTIYSTVSGVTQFHILTTDVSAPRGRQWIKRISWILINIDFERTQNLNAEHCVLCVWVWFVSDKSYYRFASSLMKHHQYQGILQNDLLILMFFAFEHVLKIVIFWIAVLFYTTYICFLHSYLLVIFPLNHCPCFNVWRDIWGFFFKILYDGISQVPCLIFPLVEYFSSTILSLLLL